MIFCTTFAIDSGLIKLAKISPAELFDIHCNKSGAELGMLIVKEYPLEDVTLFKQQNRYCEIKHYEGKYIVCRHSEWIKFKQELALMTRDKLSDYEFHKIRDLILNIEK